MCICPLHRLNFEGFNFEDGVALQLIDWITNEKIIRLNLTSATESLNQCFLKSYSDFGATTMYLQHSGRGCPDSAAVMVIIEISRGFSLYLGNHPSSVGSIQNAHIPLCGPPPYLKSPQFIIRVHFRLSIKNRIALQSRMISSSREVHREGCRPPEPAPRPPPPPPQVRRKAHGAAIAAPLGYPLLGHSHKVNDPVTSGNCCSRQL